MRAHTRTRTHTHTHGHKQYKHTQTLTYTHTRPLPTNAAPQGYYHSLGCAAHTHTQAHALHTPQSQQNTHDILICIDMYTYRVKYILMYIHVGACIYRVGRGYRR